LFVDGADEGALLRTAPASKADVLILDMVGVAEQLTLDAVVELVGRKAPLLSEAAPRERPPEQGVEFATEDGRLVAREFQTHRARCRWVNLPEGWYALSMLADGWITVEPDDQGTWSVIRRPKRGTSTVEYTGLAVDLAKSVGERVATEKGSRGGLPMHQRAGWLDRPLSEKALAYGLPGLQVDGNDVLAVYSACQEAVARARAGDGPTLVECVTYRLGVHTTADDPTKYRSTEEVEAWERKDPLTRFGAYMQKKKLLDDGLVESVDAEIAAAVKRFEALGTPDPLGMFEHAYATRPPHLEAQRAALAARLRNGDGPGPKPATDPPSPPMRGQRTSRR
jgi:hypothetical protein